jgi:hypothetical protein
MCHIWQWEKKAIDKKNLVKNTNLRLVKKIVPIELDLLKSTYPRRLRGFFYCCHFKVVFGLKTEFEKPKILVVMLIRNEKIIISNSEGVGKAHC